MKLKYGLDLYILKALCMIMIFLAIMAFYTGVNIGEALMLLLILPMVIFVLWKFDEIFWFEKK
jgi:hypothetical protein